jgi:hypothetical protein
MSSPDASGARIWQDRSMALIPEFMRVSSDRS